jgi:hypothetical protein
MTEVEIRKSQERKDWCTASAWMLRETDPRKDTGTMGTEDSMCLHPLNRRTGLDGLLHVRMNLICLQVSYILHVYD